MCGRYALDAPEKQALPKQFLRQSLPLPAGEVRPSDAAPVLTRRGVEFPVWGFLRPQGSGLIINARCESARQKPLFRRAFAEGRAAAPASAFFEWRGKRQYRFTLPDRSYFYIAALCGLFSGALRFVLLTTAANASVAAVHERMPLLLPEDALESWLHDEAAACALLESAPPPLRCDPPAPECAQALSLF